MEIRHVNKNFHCDNCGGRFKKLVQYEEEHTKCPSCGDKNAYVQEVNEFNRELLDKTYRMSFSDTNAATKQYHPVTDVLDKDLSNLYGDPKPGVRHINPENRNINTNISPTGTTNRNRNNNEPRQTTQTSQPRQTTQTSQPRQTTQTSQPRQTTQTSQPRQTTPRNASQTGLQSQFQHFFGGFPFQERTTGLFSSYETRQQPTERRVNLNRLSAFSGPSGLFMPFVSPFAGTVHRSPINFIFGDMFGAEDLFSRPNDEFFMDNFSSNFTSNFDDPLTRIVFINSMNENQPGKPSASKEAIKNLKKFKMNEEYCKKDEKGTLEYPSCSVCLTDINKDEPTLLIPCGHMFHEPCVMKWLDTNNTCPVCRYELPTDDAEYERTRISSQPTNSTQQNANLNNNIHNNNNSNVNMTH